MAQAAGQQAGAVAGKAITFPTDAKLLHAAIKGLNRMPNKHGVRLRQSYLRIAKRAAMMAGRYLAKLIGFRVVSCTSSTAFAGSM